MLDEVLNESKCKVCIIDVGNLPSPKVADIFRGVHSIIEEDSNIIKFMGLVSGHGERDIIGKQSNTRRITQALVLWSWSEQESQAHCDGTLERLYKVKAAIYL